MPDHVIRKDLSALGFYLVLFVILMNLAANALMGVWAAGVMIADYLRTGTLHVGQLQSALAVFSEPLGLLSLNAASQYLVGMPVIAYIVRKRLPTIAVRQYLPAYYEQGSAAPAQTEEPLRLRDLFSIFAIIVFFMVAGSMIGSGLAAIFGDALGVTAENSQIDTLLSGNTMLSILFVVILAPIAEELFFRKMLIDQVKPLGRRGAVLASAMAFALFHQNLYQFFYALFLGALFAIVYLKTEKIGYTIALHMLVNFAGGIVMPWCTRGLDGTVVEGTPAEMTQIMVDVLAANPRALVFLVIYLALALVGMVQFFRWLAKGKFLLAERFGTAPYRIFRGAFFTAPGQIVYMLLCVGLMLVSLAGILG